MYLLIEPTTIRPNDWKVGHKVAANLSYRRFSDFGYSILGLNCAGMDPHENSNSRTENVTTSPATYALDRYTQLDQDCPDHLREAIRYCLLAPGKRLRPLLVLTANQICGGQIDDALPAACAVENRSSTDRIAQIGRFDRRCFGGTARLFVSLRSASGVGFPDC